MRERIKAFIIIFFILNLIGCNKNSEIVQKEFPLVQFLTPTYIRVNEIIKFDNIHLLEDYVILRDGNVNNEYFFYVYSYPDFKFLYSFGKKGNGPEECLLPTITKSTQGNVFAFRDHASDKYMEYILTDTVPILVERYDIKPYNYTFFWEINEIEKDSIFLLKRSNDRFNRKELWNLKEYELLDSFPNTFNLVKTLGKNYYAVFDDFWITSSGNNFAIAYYFINLLEFGKLDNGKIWFNGKVGVDVPPNFYLFNNKSGGKYQYNVDNNIVHYESLDSDEEHVYGLYFGKPWGEMENVHSSSIEVYKWDGTPVTLLRLSESISNFVVDGKTKKILGFNNQINEDYIYVYSFE